MSNRKIIKVLSSFALVFISNNASAFEPDANEAIIYQNTNFGGSAISFINGQNVSDLTGTKFGSANWNDTASSIKVGASVRLLVYENKNYAGKCVTFSGAGVGGMTGGKYSDLAGQSFNDKITSLRVGTAPLACPPQ